ncbi:ABC transporter substrate-binding protein [Oceanobacillus sp. FSL K6-2867]|uniref:ABC transporter substrate-binding protein n=1 Tax=Oceanobacillus sp. FSL K6-2867 TaxID=2954748 RepID=UPI0030D94D39
MKNIYILVCLFVVAILAGCTDSSANGETNNNGGNNYSITDFAGQEVTFEQVPGRIAALSSGEMDIIYALGGELVGRPSTDVGVPESAVDVEQVGNTHGIDLEKIASVQPDVVLGNVQMNSKDTASIHSLHAQMVLTEANSIEDIQEQIRLFGEMLQKQDKAEVINAEINEKIEALHKEDTDPVRVLLVYGAPGTFMTALPNSLSGNILEAVGGENIASDFESLEAYPQYAQLNTERIIEANPQYILLMSHGDPEAVESGFIEEMEKNPAWNNLDAVKAGNIEVLPADLFGTNPGTRVMEAMELLEELLATVSNES